MSTKEEDIEKKEAETREILNKLTIAVAEISNAIVGNPLTKDGGLAGRIAFLEKDNLEMKKQILELDNEIILNELKDKQIRTLIMAVWAGITTIIFMIFGAITNHYFNKKDS